MTLIVGPSEEAKEIGRRKGELVEREYERKEYWTGFLKLARTETPMFARISPSTGTWISTQSIPFKDTSLLYSVRQHDTGGYVYLDSGEGHDAETAALYNSLLEQKQEIETAYGGEFEWTAPDGRRSATVAFRIESGGWRDKERWPEIYKVTIDAMKNFWAAVEPALERATEEKSEMT